MLKLGLACFYNVLQNVFFTVYSYKYNTFSWCQMKAFDLRKVFLFNIIFQNTI